MPGTDPQWLNLDALGSPELRQETSAVIRDLQAATEELGPLLKRAGLVWQQMIVIATDGDAALEKAGLGGSSELWSFIEAVTGSRELFVLMMGLSRSADPDTYTGEWMS